MKTMVHEGRTFWQTDDAFAIRPLRNDRMEFLDWRNGEVMLKNRTVPKWLNEKVTRQFNEEGIA